MAKVMLNGSGIVAVVGKFVAAGMAQHVAVNEKREPGSLPGPGNHALIFGRAEGSTALGDEHIRTRRLRLPLQPPQGSPSLQQDARWLSLPWPYVHANGRW
jgi:hypothetical protein